MPGPDAIEIPITTDTTRFAAQTAKATQSLLTLEKAQIAVNAALGVARQAWDTLVKAQIDSTRQIDRLAKTSQLTTRTVAGLRLAAQQVGKEVEDIVPKGLGDRLADLRDGTQSVVDDFALIGLSAKDFAAVNYDLDASLGLILNGLRDAPSAMNRAAAATRLLEGEGELILGTFSGGADELERFAVAAERVGAGTPEAAAAARELASAGTALNLAMEEVGATLTEFAGSGGAGGLAKDFAVGFAFALDAAASSLKSLATQAKEINGVEVFRALVLGEGLSAFVSTADGVRALGDALGAGRKNAAAMGQALTGAAAALVTIDGSGGSSAPVRKVTQAVKAQAEAVDDAAVAWDSYPAALGASLAMAFGVQAAHNELVAMANDEARAEEQAAELAALRAWSDARAKATADELAQIERSKDARQAAAIASIGYAENALGSIVALADGTNSEIRGVLTAVAVAERAASVARSLFQVGPAYAQGLAAAPPPFGFALGALNAGAVVAAAAAAAVAPLPRFHTGGTAPDETVAVLKKDETVLTPEAANAYNAGRGGNGPTEAIVVIGHQAIDRASVRALQDPGSGLAKAITRGDLPGRTRRRRP